MRAHRGSARALTCCFGERLEPELAAATAVVRRRPRVLVDGSPMDRLLLPGFRNVSILERSSSGRGIWNSRTGGVAKTRHFAAAAGYFLAAFLSAFSFSLASLSLRSASDLAASRCA